MAMFGEWTHRENEMPMIGQSILFWHPMYELIKGSWDMRDGFWSANNGNFEKFTNIEWWMPIPEAPPKKRKRKNKLQSSVK